MAILENEVKKVNEKFDKLIFKNQMKGVVLLGFSAFISACYLYRAGKYSGNKETFNQIYKYIILDKNKVEINKEGA